MVFSNCSTYSHTIRNYYFITPIIIITVPNQGLDPSTTFSCKIKKCENNIFVSDVVLYW